MLQELNIDMERDGVLVMLHADSFKALDHPVVKECSSGLLIEMSPESTTTVGVGPRRLVCYPPAKMTDVRQSSLLEDPDMMGGLFHSDARSLEDHRARVFKLMISDKARFVSLYHYDGQWRVCSSELADCSDPVLRVQVRMGSRATKSKVLVDNGGHDDMLEYLAFKSKTHYNYWEIMEETLVKPRQAFANFANHARRVDLMGNRGKRKSESKDEGEALSEDKRARAYTEGKTLREYFWEIWGERGYRLPEDTSLCYTFIVSVAAIDACEHLPSQGTSWWCARVHQCIY
jgi:hypothetical protein